MDIALRPEQEVIQQNRINEERCQNDRLKDEIKLPAMERVGPVEVSLPDSEEDNVSLEGLKCQLDHMKRKKKIEQMQKMNQDLPSRRVVEDYIEEYPPEERFGPVEVSVTDSEEVIAAGSVIII